MPERDLALPLEGGVGGSDQPEQLGGVGSGPASHLTMWTVLE